MKNKFWRILLLGCILLAAAAAPVQAQSADLTLYLSKTMGYNSGSDIRGSFRMSVKCSQPLQSVTYLIDGQPITTVTTAPYETKINTAQFANGWHELSAQAVLKDGSTVASTPKRYNFVSAEAESAGMRRILFPVLGVVFGVMLLMVLVQTVLAKKKHPSSPEPGTQRDYGISGGAICRKCGRPTPVHWMGFNLGPRVKFDRCENCGKWGVMKIVSLEKLREAEAAERREVQAAPQVTEPSEEEKLRKELDESKYTDVK
jgi:hypothetical protein